MKIALGANRLSTKVRQIRFAGGETTKPDLLATDEHLIWVDGKGWTMAGKLAPGDWLLTAKGGRVQVAANQSVGGTMKVYTVKLVGDIAFYADDVLVHDLCGNELPLGMAAAKRSEVVK